MLSDRIRPNVEAAQWVIDEVKKLEQELEDAYAEMRKIRPVGAVFDRDVWERALKVYQDKSWFCLLCKSGTKGRHGTLDDGVTPCPNA